MYVCLWSPSWSTAGESAGSSTRLPTDVAVLLADLAPRLRVDREVIWVDGRGLDAERLAERLVERTTELGMAARAGVGAIPVVAELAARLGESPGEDDAGTPFLVKERTGWGWRRTLRPSSTGSPAVSGANPAPALPPSRGRPARPTATRREGAPSPPPPSHRNGRNTPPPATRHGGCGEETGKGPTLSEAGPGGAVVTVEKGEEEAWLADLPVDVLDPSAPLRPLLDGMGIHTLGTLASLEREAVEVRLGAAAVDLWRLARGDDRRLLFDRIPPERPHGSMDFVDYVLTDPSRLLFTANALLAPLCDRLTGRGEHARALLLTLPLADGQTWAKSLRPARPTASRETWLRLIRELLDHLTVPDAVAGMRIEVLATEEAAVRQGDLFDRGFATASAVEAAVARLAERQVYPLVPESDAHPLVERRGRWGRASGIDQRASPPVPPLPRSGGAVGASLLSSGGSGEVGFALQLLDEPRRIAVETKARRDHEVPVRIRERGSWRGIAVAAGPDRISGGQWEASSYAREYYRCVTEEGVPLWIFRDALDGGWYLQGWWD